MTKTVAELSRDLEELRAALAKASGTAPATVTEIEPNPATPSVGDVVHVLAPVAFAGEVRTRGEVVTITAKILDLMKDRHGRDTLATFLDEDYQQKRYGKRIIARGAWPDGLRRWETPGDPQWSREFIAARDAARSIHDSGDRAEAEAAVRAQFGQPPEGWREPPRQARSKWSY